MLKNGCSSGPSQLHSACETGCNIVMGPSVKLLQLQTACWQGDASSGGVVWDQNTGGRKSPALIKFSIKNAADGPVRPLALSVSSSHSKSVLDTSDATISYISHLNDVFQRRRRSKRRAAAYSSRCLRVAPKQTALGSPL